MNSKLLKILIFCCIGLVIILFAEWFYADYSKKQLLNSLENSAEQAYENSQLPEIDLSIVPIDHYTEMIEQPLFIQQRKPIVETDNNAEPIIDIGSIEDWVLVGIYSNADQLTALFKNLDEQNKHLKKIQGEVISGWLLKEVLPNSVIVERSGKTQNIKLRKPRAVIKPKAKPKFNTRLLKNMDKKTTPEKKNEK